MGSYRQHIGVASFLGVSYAWALSALAGIHWIYGTVAALLATLGGLLPDLDSQSGVEMRGFTGVLASSARREHAEIALGLLEQEHMAHGWVCAEDVEVSKPAPDLIDVAVDKVGGDRAVVVGDSVWDIQAAQEHKAPAVGLRCGGFSEAELRDAGAVLVYDTPEELVRRFDESGIRLERPHQG